MSNRTSLALAVALDLLAGCAPTNSSNSTPDAERASPREVVVDDALVQFSLVAALAAGDFVGEMRLQEVLDDGDFGLGAFSRLDGEMIVLDGKIYQALADGTVRQADLDGTAAFAAVTFFDEDSQIGSLSADTLDELDAQLDQHLARPNLPYAIRLEGEFASLTLRSVPAQSEPYPPLVEVVKQQVTWQHRNLRGVLVGLRCPAWIDKLNVAGYHWHFLSDDRQIGGHVLACDLRSGAARLDECTSLVVRLPQSRTFDEFDAATIKSEDIDRIERDRSGAKPQ